MAVLITGGSGYIGSHTCAELLETGRDIIVVDRPEHAPALDRVQAAVGRRFPFHPLGLMERRGLQRIFEENEIEAVIHFAGIHPAAMPQQGCHLPIVETVVLCDVMQQFGVRRLVFSSSAAVYGKPKQTPVTESSPLGATNRYGRTMLMIEEILHDLYEADRKWSIALLRNFNPAGAHPSGWIDGEAAGDGLSEWRGRESEGAGGSAWCSREAEGAGGSAWRIRTADSAHPGERTCTEPAGTPQHLMSRLMRAAAGQQDKLPVFGGDYPTRDGTCVRDYVHVTDLAKGHVKALAKVMADSGIDAYNLGTGAGHSVLEVIAAFEQAAGIDIPYQIVERRPGDAPVICADPSKARRELGWQAEMGLGRMCEDAWRWLRRRTDGFRAEARHRMLAGAGGAAG
ncbi:UDP-glucose 4-epimerase [Thermobacillus composti KWC4]|uniref:UDP-glucose 4-epimerase n=1 Tax=Thermobacillus composti (strain DSM 18247 / JCM 13945 / KWC4) TaxID=717605 RepID=L0EHE8_THECK|nr:UDP-glucose 4-epimerase [Thermobacillus composti]AGA59222.1 UDP-glucose 4-epimerase [Thermobacillus composti KWC4]